MSDDHDFGSLIAMSLAFPKLPKHDGYSPDHLPTFLILLADIYHCQSLKKFTKKSGQEPGILGQKQYNKSVTQCIAQANIICKNKTGTTIQRGLLQT